jgi:hypothetical protein
MGSSKSGTLGILTTSSESNIISFGIYIVTEKKTFLCIWYKSTLLFLSLFNFVRFFGLYVFIHIVKRVCENCKISLTK